jgi:hypothetical protein
MKLRTQWIGGQPRSQPIVTFGIERMQQRSIHTRRYEDRGGH